MHIGREPVGVPLRVRDDVEVDAADIPSRPPGSNRCRDLGFDNRRTVNSTQILIVDTDRTRCNNIAEMIQTIGRFGTLFAHSSADALTRASECLPGVVLLNTDLPQMQCYGLATMLHQRAALCDARLIALTTEIASADRHAALIAGFEQFLTLPLQPASLSRVLMRRSHRGPARSRIL